jgi:hypothetical protein
MKTYTRLSRIITLIIIALALNSYSNPFIGTPDSVQLGPGYANDVYYSFENGVVATPARTNWDIGFRTSVWTASIITNGAAGVTLYTYPNSDTTGWATADTTGIAGWTVMYDSEKDWEEGAFNRNQLGHPDYGWGKYNPITHDVVGDSIYFLKTLDGTFKKIWIVRKNSSNNRYYLRTANLDGSNDHTVELDINPYQNANFVYYAFSTESVIEREPDTASWDVLFTKYMAIQPDGTPYPVVGVLNNQDVYANEFHPVLPDFSDYAGTPFDSTKSAVGWEWKTFDMGSFTWSVEDSTAFFVFTKKDNVYKLVFTRFEGSSTGNIVFTKEPMTSGITDHVNQSVAKIYPNPVTDHMTIDFGREINNPAMISIYDLTGRMVFSSVEEITHGRLTINLPGSAGGKGLYLLQAGTAEGIYSSRFMVY